MHRALFFSFGIICLLLQGCSYYAVKTLQPPNLLTEEQLEDKFVVIHFKSVVYHFEVSAISEEGVTGKLQPLPPDHDFYKTTYPSMNRYSKRTDSQVLDEVHIMTTIDPVEADEEMEVPFSSIIKIAFHKKDPSPYLAAAGISTLVLYTATVIYEFSKIDLCFVCDIF